MKIILEIADADINEIAGNQTANFIEREIRRDPEFFLRLAVIKIEAGDK